MTRKIAIIKSDNNKINESVKSYFQHNKEIEITEINENEISNAFDLIALTYGRTNVARGLTVPVINLHPSLLPAFQTNDAIKESYLYGVKVTGITVHYVHEDNFHAGIIAQFPILVGEGTKFNEYEEEISNIAAKTYPVVIEKIAQDKIFDFGDLQTGCNGGSCNNCGKCVH